MESRHRPGAKENRVPQPVAGNRLQNVPQKGVYGWLPTAYFGVHRPDGFWFDE